MTSASRLHNNAVLLHSKTLKRKKMAMLILIDLDGTLVNTVHPMWKDYKDGRKKISYDRVPLIYGAKEFVQLRKEKGDSVVIVSDSHPIYVNEVAKLFDVEAVSLTDKPNDIKIRSFIQGNECYQNLLETGHCIVIGDTKLDIELGRKLKAMTMGIIPYIVTNEIKDERDGIGDRMAIIKYGPTFFAKNFIDADNIIDSLLGNLYTLESIFAGSESTRSIIYNTIHDNNDRNKYYAIRCLARQQSGVCDSYARADMYYQLSNPERTGEYLDNLAMSVTRFLTQESVKNERWDLCTYVPDKTTTNPPNKMKAVFTRIDSDIPKQDIFLWETSTVGSLRSQPLYEDRKKYLERYLKLNSSIDIKDKSIVVIDDQLTTGATAYYICHLLINNGAKKVLFVTLFQMTLEVLDNKVCPRCGKNMRIKINRQKGTRFYSCVSPAFGGEGCGYIENIND